MAGKSLKDSIVPWLATNQTFIQQNKFKGISFCHDNVWKAYKIDSRECVEKGTSIADDETFVIFDEYRTRGADMKMDSTIVGVMSISQGITKDSLMQAAGRLRKIGREQKLILILTPEVKNKIKQEN